MSLGTNDIISHEWACGANWVWCPVPALSELLCAEMFLYKLCFIIFECPFWEWVLGSGEGGGGEGSNSPKNNSTHPSLIVGYYTY